MSPSRRRSLLSLLALVLASSGCVKKSTHQVVLDDLAATRGDLLRQTELEDSLRGTLDDERDARRAEEASLRARIAELEEEIDQLEQRRATAESRFEEAREEVYRLEVVLSDRGTEYRRLQQRLQQLAAIEREIRERNAIYEEVIGRFQSLIDGGRVAVSIANGRMVIQLPQDILFGSGSAALGADGRTTLREVGGVLAELGDRRFQVEGHTDDVPISTERFPSNWELSSARALSVVQVLIQAGVPPQSLSGAGYGEHQPVADNEDREGRRRNRRIEIVMLPNLDVIAGTQLQD